MDCEQLRLAFRSLNGLRDLRVRFESADDCLIPNALLVPAEEDGLIKLTDGSTEYVLDINRISWIEIRPPAASH